jgi:hypothetical protein
MTASRRIRIAAVAGLLAIALAGLFARIMTYPLRHDEQMYLPAGVLVGKGSLYSDFAFNHLPNLPLLLHAVFTLGGVEHFLLAGRLVTFGFWLLAAAGLALIGTHIAGSATAGAFAVLMLLTNTLLLDQTGMLVSNNFAPIPFAIFGFYWFVSGLQDGTPGRGRIALSGFCLAVAAGLKANYVFVILPFALLSLLLPTSISFARRLTAVAAPLAVGGVVGALPTLYFLAAGPESFLTLVYSYHTGPHIAYWRANDDPAHPVSMSLSDKLQLAHLLWLSGSSAVVALLALGLALLRAREAGGSGGLGRLLRWPSLLAIGLAILGAMVSFVPTPAFPQYFAPPLAFLFIFAALCYGSLSPSARVAGRPFLYASGAVLLVMAAPKLFGDLPKLASPAEWTGYRVHRVAERIREQVDDGGVWPAKLATLSPIYALEGGLEVYRELSAGPFIYRLTSLIPEADRSRYPGVSPDALPRLLDREPPAGILVGFEGELDARLIEYAKSRGYVRLDGAFGSDRYGVGALYVRPAGAAPTGAQVALPAQRRLAP